MLRVGLQRQNNIVCGSLKKKVSLFVGRVVSTNFWFTHSSAEINIFIYDCIVLFLALICCSANTKWHSYSTLLFVK